MSHAHAKHPTREEAMLPQKSPWRSLHMVAGGIGVLGLGLSLALGLGGENETQLYFSYLVAFVFFLSIGLGAMFFVLVQHLTRAGWSVTVRRVSEHLMGTLPLFALLFIPIAFQIPRIYERWAGDREHLAQTDPHWNLVAHKLSYLNQGAFLTRAVIFLVLWTLISWYFRKRSLDQDTTGEHAITRRLQMLAAPGIAVFSLTLTFASFDWIMSLDPHWFSTIFGVYYFAGSAVAMLATLSLLIIALRSSGLLRGVVTAEHDQDVGKLLFGFNVFWTYIAFSQYILIWYANIPEETLWYFHRQQGSWAAMTTLLAVGHFVIPFFFLMSRHIKRVPTLLGVGAAWLLVMHYVDLYWLIMPTLHHEGVHFSVLDLTTFLGIGGLFVATFAFLMRDKPLIPVRDPRLTEALTFQNY